MPVPVIDIAALAARIPGLEITEDDGDVTCSLPAGAGAVEADDCGDGIAWLHYRQWDLTGAITVEKFLIGIPADDTDSLAAVMLAADDHAHPYSGIIGRIPVRFPVNASPPATVP